MPSGLVTRQYQVSPPADAEIDFKHPLARGLVGYWPMLEGAGDVLHDYSGRSKHGTLTNMDNADWVVSNIGPALDFDGFDDVVVLDSDTIDFDNSFSIVAWINLHDAKPGNAIMGKGRSWQSPSVQFFSSSEKRLRFSTFDAGGNDILDTAADVLTVGKWHHVVATCNQETGDKHIYLDGESIASNANGDTGIDDSGDLHIGNQGSLGLWPYDGLISTVALWSRALTASDIAQLYRDPWPLFEHDEPVVIAGEAPVGDYELLADPGDFDVTGSDADLRVGKTLAAEFGQYLFFGMAADLLRDAVVAAESGAFTLAGTDAELRHTALLVADTGAFAWTGQDAGLIHDARFPAESGIFVLAGTDADLYRVLPITAESGAFNLAGQDVSFTYSQTLAAESGTYTLAGQDVDFIRNSVLAAESGTFALVGQDANLVYQPVGAYTIVGESGPFSLAGQDAGLVSSRIVVAQFGIFNVFGAPAELTRTATFIAESGPFVLEGQDADLIYQQLNQYVIVADSGPFSLAGQDANLIYQPIGYYTVIGDSGDFQLIGSDAELRHGFIPSYKIEAESGDFQLEGQDAHLLYPPDMPASTWTGPHECLQPFGTAKEILYKTADEALRINYIFDLDTETITDAQVSTTAEGVSITAVQFSGTVVEYNLSGGSENQNVEVRHVVTVDDGMNPARYGNGYLYVRETA